MLAPVCSSILPTVFCFGVTFPRPGNCGFLPSSICTRDSPTQLSTSTASLSPREIAVVFHGFLPLTSKYCVRSRCHAGVGGFMLSSAVECSICLTTITPGTCRTTLIADASASSSTARGENTKANSFWSSEYDNVHQKRTFHPLCRAFGGDSCASPNERSAYQGR